MCLAIPAKVETITGDRGVVALDGNRTTVLMSLVPNARVGDYVLVHAGMAISTIDEKEALEVFDLLKEALAEGGRACEKGCDDKHQ